jgi:2-polyprenyl-3-methyl-5-hydroxy-6-metoxy-1,4-benzoquinol methylase
MNNSTSNHWDISWSQGIYKQQYEAGLRATYERYRNISNWINKFNIKFEVIVDLGCGNGEVTKHLLLEDNNRKAILVDWSKSALDKAQHNLRSLNNPIKFIDSNATTINENYKKALLLSLGVIEHFKNPETIISEMYNCIDSGSTLILMTPNRLSLVGLSRKILELNNKWTFGLQKEFSVEELNQFCIKSQFEIIHLEAMPRIYIKSDTFLTKSFSYVDRFIHFFYKKWGWYAFVICRK